MDSSGREHEKAFIEALILRERRERYLSQLQSKKNRPSFLERLNHRFIHDLDERYLTQTPFHLDLKQVMSCYIMASEGRYDAQVVTPETAADFLDAAQFGIVVSYIPGKLAAYKDEAPANLLWLERQ